MTEPVEVTIPAPIEVTIPMPDETTTTVTESTIASTTSEPTPVIPEPTLDISSDEAAAVASNPEQLAALSVDQAAAVFAALDVAELTDDEAAAIAEALSDAPEEIKATFEKEVDVFGGKFDNYVPTGSTISVAKRRTVVVVSAVFFVMPLPVPTSSVRNETRKVPN